MMSGRVHSFQVTETRRGPRPGMYTTFQIYTTTTKALPSAFFFLVCLLASFIFALCSTKTNGDLYEVLSEWFLGSSEMDVKPPGQCR